MNALQPITGPLFHADDLRIILTIWGPHTRSWAIWERITEFWTFSLAILRKPAYRTDCNTSVQRGCGPAER